MPSVDIAILTWNNLDETRRCLDGIEKTMAVYEDAECIVLDNGSSDGTLDYLKSWQAPPRKRLISVAQNVGVAVGRQRLIKASSADIIVFVDSDVVVQDTGWLQRLVDAMADEAVGAAGPAGNMVNWGLPLLFTAAPPGPVDVVSGWCLAAKTEIFEIAGVKIDHRYGLFWEEDSDLCMQIRYAGWDVVGTGDIGLAHVNQERSSGVDRGERLKRFRDKWQGGRVIRAEGGY